MRHAKPKDRSKLVAVTALATTGSIPIIAATATPASAAIYSAEQVAQVAKENCPQLSAQGVDTAVRIAKAESGWNTDINAFGSEDSRGLWQINRGAWGDQFGDLYSPANNAHAMCVISRGGTNWSPWTTYTSGAYRSQPGFLGNITVPPGSPHRIEPGMNDRDPADTNSGDSNSGDSNSGDSNSSASSYVVKPGDTLYAIALRHYGNGYKWPRIYSANRSVIGSNPNRIFPGQKLSLPGSSGTGSGTTVPPASAPSSGSLVRPCEGHITQSFHNPSAGYTLGYHTGVDIGCASGAPVHAVLGGVVVASDTSSAYGNNVQIKHADGKYTLYAHLTSKAVSPGQSVSGGATIGTVGNTGTHSSGPHLHLELRINPTFAAGNFLDPATWLASHGVHL